MIKINDKELKRWRKIFKSPRMNMDKAKTIQSKLSAAGKAGNREGKSRGGKASAAKRWNEEYNKKKAEQQTKRIQDYIYTSFDMAIDATAERVQYDIREKFYSEVDRFYSDPVFNGSSEPEVYDRTGSLYKAYRPVYEKSKEGNNKYTFGAEIDGHNIPFTPYHSVHNGKDVDPWYVFNLFYKQGSHGDDIVYVRDLDIISVYSAQYTHPPAKSVMDDWWDKYKLTANAILNEEFNNMLRKNRKMLKG